MSVTNYQRELTDLAEVFNDLLDRLEQEWRRQGGTSSRGWDETERAYEALSRLVVCGGCELTCVPPPAEGDYLCQECRAAQNSR